MTSTEKLQPEILRVRIIQAIRALTSSQGGKPPGKKAFSTATGISESAWSGKLWARWSDALNEAGLPSNKWTKRLETKELLVKIAELAIEIGKLPTRAEMKLRRRGDPQFPNHSTIGNHFRDNQQLIEGLRELTSEGGFSELKALLPASSSSSTKELDQVKEGHVYLLRSGRFYKIGRTDNIERRLKEITIALPEAVTLVHSIRTDDPPGIESYWHRRFAQQRANGEWFQLTAADVRAFIRRKFQ